MPLERRAERRALHVPRHFPCGPPWGRMTQTFSLLDEKIRAATQQLRKSGKTPADAIALLRNITGPVAGNQKPFGFPPTGWKDKQAWAALELAHLCGLKELLRSASKSTRRDLPAVLTLLLDHADARENRVRCELNEMIVEMLPDYRSGKKARESGQQAYGSWADRYHQAEEFRQIDRQLSKRARPSKRMRSQSARYRDIADEYRARHPNKSVSAKTVERRVREFPVPLAILAMALRHKLN
jgi:hypothetical protein